MVNAASGAQSNNPFSLLSSAKNASTSTTSFAQQLAAALQGYLGNLGNGSHFEVDVQTGADPSSASQFTITVKNLGAAAPAAATGDSLMTAHTTAASRSSQPAAAMDPMPSPDRSKMTPTDAYWAEQPPAVQSLRDAPDDQKLDLAKSLAKQGYTIDVPIMVWGWDPLVTMTVRQNEGYTWVPSGLQPNIPIGPGIVDAWNLPAYDPGNPPPGSIKVSTDFAKGTNGIDPWITAST